MKRNIDATSSQEGIGLLSPEVSSKATHPDKASKGRAETPTLLRIVLELGDLCWDEDMVTTAQKWPSMQFQVS